MKNYRLGLYEKAMPSNLTLLQKLEAAKAAGFDYMEISIDETDDRQSRLRWTADARAQLRFAMEKVGLPIDSICLSGHRKWPLGSADPQKRDAGREMFRLAVDFARDLGIRNIQLAGYDVYYEAGDEQTRSRFLDGLREGVAYAATYGVPCGFETMETPFMDTISKAMEYVRLVHSPYLGVYPDLGNLTNAAELYNLDVATEILDATGHLFAMHLKETVPGRYRDMRFGEGRVDFVSGIRAALRAGVRCFVAEYWHQDGSDFIEQIREINRFLRERFAMAE